MLCLITGEAMATRKTDVVYLNNGDRITGEFKELVQGELKLSTAEMGSIYIKWEGVARIESDKYIEIELRDGRRVFGQLPPDMNSSAEILSIKTLKERNLSKRSLNPLWMISCQFSGSCQSSSIGFHGLALGRPICSTLFGFEA